MAETPPTSKFALTMLNHPPRLEITGSTNYNIQATSDLKTWSTIATNLSAGNFTDPNAAKYPQRFYRGVDNTASSGSANPSAGTGAANTTDVKITWDPSPDTAVAGYNVYYGTQSHTYPQKITFGNTTTGTINGLIPGSTYYFAITSYDGLGQESTLSPEVSYTAPALAQGVSANAVAAPLATPAAATATKTSGKITP